MELQIINFIRERFRKLTKKLSPEVDIGSDSFALKFSGKLVVTSDAQIEGTHFTFDLLTAEEVGERAVRTALSDLASAGALPLLILSNISSNSSSKIKGILKGIEKACKEFDVVPAGGDTSFSQTTAVHIFAVGRSKGKVLSRKGAKPGDFLFVSGELGSSALIFRIAQKLGRKRTMRVAPGLWERFVRPPVRFDIVPRIRRIASACADISDGLFKTAHLLAEENQLWAKIYVERVPVSSEFAVLCDRFGLDPDEISVSGGEDYELLFSVPPSKYFGALKIGFAVGYLSKTVTDLDGTLHHQKGDVVGRVILSKKIHPKVWSHPFKK